MTTQTFFSGVIVPEEWSSIRLSHLAGECGLFTDGDWIESPYITNAGYRLIQTGNIGIGNYREQGFRYISEKTFHALKCEEVRPGDILICRLADPVGRACLAPDPGSPAITSVDNVILRTGSGIEPRFFVYLFSSEPYLKYLGSECRGGTRNRVSRSFLGRIRLPFPDLPTQKAIAAFLDRETARTDQLIEKKQRLVELLGEKRFALLDRLTFQHCDAETWACVPFKWLCRIPSGQVDPTTEPWSSLPLIAPNHIESQTGRLSEAPSAEAQGAISGKYVFEASTVLYSKIRPALAKACIAPRRGVCSADMYPIIPDRSRLTAEYLLMQLLSRRFTDWAVLEAMRVAMPKINRDALGRVQLLSPPLAEQDRLAAQWSRERGGIERAQDAIESSIDRLKEYRSALITAAVTGQIDVETWSRRGEGDRRLDRIEEEMAG